MVSPSLPKYKRYPGPKSMRYSNTPALTPFTFEQVSKLQPSKRRRHFRSCGGVETPKPDRERIRTGAVEIFEDRQQPHGNISVTIWERDSHDEGAGVAGRCRVDVLPGESDANVGAVRPTGAILVGFVAMPVSDRRRSGAYHNPGFGRAARP